MKRFASIITTFLAVCLTAQPIAPANADIAKGEKNFKRCTACHTLEKGKNRVGPSLYQVYGRKAGQVPKFKYSKGLQEAAAKGLVWNRENLMEYLKDPRKFLRDFTGNKKASNKMLQKFKNEKFRQYVIDYLESLSKDPKKS